MPNNQLLELAVCPPAWHTNTAHMGDTQAETRSRTLFLWKMRWLIKTELSAQSKFTVSLQDSGNYTYSVKHANMQASLTQLF